MEVMVPFYYAVVALFFGVVGGFCTKCYQISENGKFIYVLKNSTRYFLKTSLIAFLFPILVILSNEFRKLFLFVLIHDAEEDYTVSINDEDKDSLVEVILERTSSYNITKIALSFSWFYFSNLDYFANATIKNIVDTSQSFYKHTLTERSKNFFGGKLSFYKKNIFAQTLFCL